jgi:serine/threonine protein kinase
MDTYEKILSSDPSLPPAFSKGLCDLILKLLKKNPSKRLGSGKGGANLVVRVRLY